MTLDTPRGSLWPSRIANVAAAIFIGASLTTNIIYGWQKGSDLPSSLVWAGVSAGVAIILALSMPAIIRSFEAKRYSATAIAVVAMLLSGAYSLTAALGSAAGGRMNAAATEMATIDARAKTQAAYEMARREIDALTSVKPRAALEAQIEVLHRHQCRL